MYSCCSYHRETKIEITPLRDGDRFEEDRRVDEEERVYLKVNLPDSHLVRLLCCFLVRGDLREVIIVLGYTAWCFLVFGFVGVWLVLLC